MVCAVVWSTSPLSESIFAALYCILLPIFFQIVDYRVLNFNTLRLCKVDFCDDIIIIAQNGSTISYEISIVTAVKWSTFGINIKVCIGFSDFPVYFGICNTRFLASHQKLC